VCDFVSAAGNFSFLLIKCRTGQRTACIPERRVLQQL